MNEQFLGRSGIIDWTLTDAMIGEAYAERFVEAWMGDNVSYYVDPGNNPTSKDPGSPKIHEIREPANVGTTNGSGMAGGSVQFKGEQTWQNPDPAYQFHLVEDERMAYLWMRAMMDLKDGDRINGVETVGVLSINQQTNKKGVLILPWAGNGYDESNAGVGYDGKYFKDHNGTLYTPLAIIHTHPNNEVGPVYWGTSRFGDLSTARTFGNLPLYILGSLSYVQFWPHSSEPGSRYDLIRENNPLSLFPND